MNWKQIKHISGSFLNTIAGVGGFFGLIAYFGVYGDGVGNLLSLERIGAWNVIQLGIIMIGTILAVGFNIISTVKVKGEKKEASE